MVSPFVARRATIVASAYICLLFFIQPIHPSEGYNAFVKHLPEYRNVHFYALNSFDYLIAKAYLGEERLGSITSAGRSMIAVPGQDWKNTQRVEDFEIVKRDREGFVIWNVEFPLERRDDRRFEELKRF